MKAIDNDKILKAAREKLHFTCMGAKIWMLTNFLSETVETRLQWSGTFKVLTYSISRKISFYTENKIYIPDKWKLREFSTIRSVLKKNLNVLLLFLRCYHYWKQSYQN